MISENGNMKFKSEATFIEKKKKRKQIAKHHLRLQVSFNLFAGR